MPYFYVWNTQIYNNFFIIPTAVEIIYCLPYFTMKESHQITKKFSCPYKLLSIIEEWFSQMGTINNVFSWLTNTYNQKIKETKIINSSQFSESSVQFTSVIQSSPTLCNSMNRSTPGFPVHHQLPESNQTHVRRVDDAIVPFSSCPQSFLASASFSMSQLFTSGGQSVGVSASTSVLPMNTQDWSPLGWTGWISLQSKRLSQVFSKTTVQKHQLFGAQLSLWYNCHIHTWPLKKPVTRWTFVGKVMSLLFNILNPTIWSIYCIN